LPYLTSSPPQKQPHSFARELQPTTRFATRVCEPETWSLFRALAALVILASSLPGTRDSVLWLSDADVTRKSLRKICARVSTSMLLSRIPQRCCSAWAERELFSQREPVVMPWGDLCPVWQLAANS